MKELKPTTRHWQLITLVNNGKYIISTVDLSPHETYVFSAENEKIKDFYLRLSILSVLLFILLPKTLGQSFILYIIGLDCKQRREMAGISPFARGY